MLGKHRCLFLERRLRHSHIALLNSELGSMSFDSLHSQDRRTQLREGFSCQLKRMGRKSFGLPFWVVGAEAHELGSVLTSCVTGGVSEGTRGVKFIC